MPTKNPYNMPVPFGGIGGVNCDGFLLNDGTENVFRQPVSIGDPTTWGNAAAVAGAALAGTEQGMAVRSIDSAPNAAGATSQTAVGASAVQVTSGSPSANRRKVKVRNMSGSAGPIFVGFSNAVTTATGYELLPGESENFDVGPALTLWAIAGATGNTVCVTEIG